MASFIAGMILGGCMGFILAALMVVVNMEDEQVIIENKEYYKCKNNMFEACADTCCKYCLGASECKWACEMDPSECKQAIRLK